MKPKSPADLLEAVRKAARAETTLHPRAAAKTMQALGSREKEEGPVADLSRR